MNWSLKTPVNILQIKDEDSTVLTKDLLRYKTNRGTILPKFIDPKSKINLEVARGLINAFSTNVGSIRETLEGISKQVIQAYPSNAVVGRGLEKLLMDRTEFDTEINNDLIELREKVFKNSAFLLRQNESATIQKIDIRNNESFTRYKSEMNKLMGLSSEELGTQLYGDLPPFQQVLNFRKLTAEELLHRYNCAQVQGLLLRSESMMLTLPESGPAKLRQLLKYLRFNKLLAKIVRDHKKNSKALTLKIDGPLSLFVQTQKYGLNLANFFAAVLLQPKWKIDAQIRILKNQVHSLNLDESCGIRSHLRQFLSYVPDEIQILSKQITEKLPDWELTSSSDFVALEGESLCFPDYLITHKSGKSVSLELFHKWHSTPLKMRLDQLDLQKGSPLLIGIHKSLLKNDEIANQVQASKYFSRFGFFFREAPTVTKLLPVLDKWLGVCI